MEDGQDPELVSEFVSESLRGLQSVEQDLLLLEEDGGADVDLVNRIFRAVHSIKGAGAFLCLDNLVTVSHQAETLLDDIRAGRRSASADVTDAVLGAIDCLVAMLEEPDQGLSYDCSPILGKLGSVLGEGDAGPSHAPAPKAEPVAAPQTQRAEPPSDMAEFLACEQPEERDPELLAQFIEESLKGLEDIEQDLLALETDGGTDRELVNRIFRTIHSIKGAASFLMLDNLVSITHRAETVLDRVRSGTMEVTAQVTDATLSVVDAVVAMLKAEDYGQSHDCEAIRLKLDALIDGNGHVAADQSISKSDLDVLNQITDRRNPIYRMHVDLEKLHEAIDIKEGVIAGLSSVGKVRHASIPIEAIDTTLSGACTLYFETMLEPDLLAHHLHIREDEIQKVELSEKPKRVDANASAAPKAGSQPPKPSTVAGKAQPDAPPKAAKPAGPTQPSPSQSVPDAAKSKPAPPPKAKSAGTEAATQTRVVEEQTMRVPARILHELLEWTGNMVMARNQLLNEYDFRNSNAFRTLSQAITGVHETVIETRMQTTGSLFDRYRRVVRDLSRQLGKEVAFHIEGGDLELDRTILESFADPLTHLVRNCIDHAIETPDERVANGKNRQGNVYLRSYVQSGEIILEVEDDGRGISASYVCTKAIEKGLITADKASEMSDDQKVMLIFEAGFSTKDQATDISGRGVGMDVVRNNIESVGGTIDLKTQVGKGAVFAARLPLAKALVSSSLTSALVIELGDECLAIPETAISEIIHYDQKAMELIRQVDGRCVYQHRDKLVALIDLRKPLGLEIETPNPKSKAEKLPNRLNGAPPARSKRSCLVIIQFRDQLFGTVVDEVVGMQEIIVRSNPQLIQDCTVYSGHTVLGNGRIALILDVNGIVNKMALKFPHQSERTVRDGATAGREERSSPATTQKMLIFNNADSEYFAIPIELVAFIERIQLDDLKIVGAREFCQLKAETLSIVRLESFLPVTPLNRDRKDMCLIRPAAVEHPIGVITGLDLHVVDVAETYETRLDDVSGILGTFYFNDKLVMLIDLFCVLEKHAPDKLKQTDDSTQHARILIAEDSLFFRKLIAQYVQRDEWEVDIVNDGQEAYERLMNEPTRYNLIISDINMPRMDGFELAKKVREDKRFDTLPMVALTTMSDEYFREKGIRLGFDRYVIKIDKREVRTTVAECLRIKRGKP